MKTETPITEKIPAVDQPPLVRPLGIGAKVWIYEGKAPPRDGTITASGECIVTGAWYVRDTFGERLYNKHSLFTNSERLIAEVQYTVDLLERWEREFQPNVKEHAPALATQDVEMGGDK